MLARRSVVLIYMYDIETFSSVVVSFIYSILHLISCYLFAQYLSVHDVVQECIK